MGRLQDKVAIITGGSRGMGRAYCLRFGEEGAIVAVVYHERADAAAEVVDAITANGGRAKAFQCDVTKPAESKAMVAAVADEFGGVDILINNAGLYLFTPLDETTEAEWDSQLNTTLKGPFFCAQAVLPYMKARGGGKIINIGSIFGEDGYPGSSGYCASKGAIKQLTRTLCLELRPFNIQVNTLSPGCVETDLNKEYREESDDFMSTLQGRFGEGEPWQKPEEMAGTAVFLASSDADSVTGANVMVDRGYSAF
jgi:NAD(P)-dependent dehydrogenase (short-subunit alcohol dehydrogenase family)